MIPDKIYIPHNKTRYPQGMCVHWNRNKNKGNYDSDDDIEYIRTDKIKAPDKELKPCMNEIKEYCNKNKMFNYGKLKDKFSDESIFIKIKTKQENRKALPEYANKYSWLTIYDEEIDFLINKIDGELNK